MNYQVLARKWRPSNFTEVVGQEHVVKSLMNALQHQRLHHAYLFTGTRGVGKTTIARILAKAINCENLQDFNPCGQCRVCRELDEGRFMDLIEVDAASRTKVEDTRDLLDNVQYAPNYARYKIYLIDEVHMLSGHSFNALLKTLEEPPPHVKFLLATTDPQKIPVTVLSRCLQFNLKRLLPGQIFKQMQEILKREQIEAEMPGLQLLSRAADGSMRDGLSLLDQAIVHGAGKVVADDICNMLGLVSQLSVESLLNGLADSNAEAILERIAEIANIQPDFGNVLQQILQILHRIALAQQLPKAVEHEFDRELIAELSQRFTPEDVQLYYQIALIGQRDLDLAPDSRMGFEMVMLRMLAFKPDKAETGTISPQPAQPLNPVPQAQPKSQTDPVSKAEPLSAMTKIKEDSSSTDSKHNWVDMIAIMKLESLTRELANNCILELMDTESCRLLLDASHQQLLTPIREKKLQQALQEYAGIPLKLTIKIEQESLDTPAVQMAKAAQDKQQATIDAINSDPNIQALKEQFDARVMTDTIAPV
jgi:DNA polymerase III subunit gamma/tau